jgi:hypothetical protein
LKTVAEQPHRNTSQPNIGKCPVLVPCSESITCYIGSSLIGIVSMHGFADKNLIRNTITARQYGCTVLCAAPKIAFFKERT